MKGSKEKRKKTDKPKADKKKESKTKSSEDVKENSSIDVSSPVPSSPALTSISSASLHLTPSQPPKLNDIQLSEIYETALICVFFPIELHESPQLILNHISESFSVNEEVHDRLINKALETCTYELVSLQIKEQFDTLDSHYFYNLESFGDRSKFLRWKENESKRLQKLLTKLQQKGFELATGKIKQPPLKTKLHELFQMLLKYSLYHHLFISKSKKNEDQTEGEEDIDTLAEQIRKEGREVPNCLLSGPSYALLEEYGERYQIRSFFRLIVWLDNLNCYYRDSLLILCQIVLILRTLADLLTNKSVDMTNFESELLLNSSQQLKKKFEDQIAHAFDHFKTFATFEPFRLKIEALDLLNRILTFFGQPAVSMSDNLQSSFKKAIENQYSITMNNIKTDLQQKEKYSRINQILTFCEVLTIDLLTCSGFEKIFKRYFEVTDLTIQTYFQLFYHDIKTLWDSEKKPDLSDICDLLTGLKEADKTFNEKFPNRKKPEFKVSDLISNFTTNWYESLSKSFCEDSKKSCEQEEWLMVNEEKGHKFSFSSVDLVGSVSEPLKQISQLQFLLPKSEASVINFVDLYCQKVVVPSYGFYARHIYQIFQNKYPATVKNWEDTSFSLPLNLDDPVFQRSPAEFPWREVIWLKDASWKNLTDDNKVEFSDMMCVHLNNLEYATKDLTVTWKVEETNVGLKILSQIKSAIFHLYLCWINVKMYKDVYLFIQKKKKTNNDLLTFVLVQLPLLHDQLLESVYVSHISAFWKILIMDIKHALLISFKKTRLMRAKEIYVDLKQAFKENVKEGINFGGLEKELHQWFGQTETGKMPKSLPLDPKLK